MPEGDTLFRAAQTLRLAIKGRVVTGIRSPLPEFRDADLIGREIIDVEARGKNLLIHFDDGRAIYSHLRMEGSWHIYKPGVPWRKPERQARVVLETHEYIAVCFNAPTVELLTATGIKRHRVLSKLGPDLLKNDFSWDVTLQRLREQQEKPIGEALMRQNILAGIGNVYKSEVLFLCHADPFLAVREYSDHDLKVIVQKARELMKQNVQGRQRTTRHSLDGERMWVYGRSGRPCRKCGTPIKMRRQGLEARSTYFCAPCQQSAHS
jgi:endonuclease-8